MIGSLICVLLLGSSTPVFTGLPDEIRLVAVDEYFPRTSDVINPSGPGITQDVEDRHVLSFIFENIALPAGDHGPWFEIAMQYPGEAPYNVSGTLVTDENWTGFTNGEYGIKVGWNGSDQAKFYIEVDKDDLPTEVHFSIRESWEEFNETTQQWEMHDYGYNPTFEISKVAANDAAIDTRKGYGQPNRDGQIMADPNSELRNVWFGDWKWRGGLFAGNMPASHDDRSGLARIQLWPSTLPSNIFFATLTLMDLGPPTMPSAGSTGGTTGETTGTTGVGPGGGGGPTGGGYSATPWSEGVSGPRDEPDFSDWRTAPLKAVYASASPRTRRATPGGGSFTPTTGTPADVPTLAVYIPDDEDTNISYNESSVWWSRRWLSIDPQGAGQGAGSGETWQIGRAMRDVDDYGTWTPGNETGGYYINWPITWVDLSPTASPIYSTPPFGHGLCLAMVDEDDQLNTVVWRYFASREYDQLFVNTEDFPNNDSKPRVWAIVLGDDHNWLPWTLLQQDAAAQRHPSAPGPVAWRR